MKLNPLTRMVLTEDNFAMGPKRASEDPGIFVRGVVQSMNLVSDATKITYRPRSVSDTLALISEGGYEADFQRAITDAMVLADAAVWRFDLLRAADNTLSLSDLAAINAQLTRSIEQALVLNSTAVNKTTYLRTITQILSLTDLARQSIFLESILDVLLLDQSSTYVTDYLRTAAHNVSLTDQANAGAELLRSLETVLLMDQTAEVTEEFLRAVESVLLLIDDAVLTNALLEAAASTLGLSDITTWTWDYTRDDSQDISVTDEATANLIPVCEQLDWTVIGQNPGSSEWGTLTLPAWIAYTGSDPVTHWTKYKQCYATNLTVSEPPSSNYGGAGPTGLTGGGKWRGGVLSEAGYLYHIPYDNAFVYKFDPSTNTGANLTTNHSGTRKWAGGGLGFTGNIVCAPNDATTILHINTANDAETTMGSYTGTSKWHGAYINKNGIAICAPRTSSQILAINTDSTSNDTWLSTGPTVPNLAGGVLAPDGTTIYVTPSSSTQVLKLDTRDHTNIQWNWLAGGPYGGFNEYFGGVLDDTGNIYFIPYNATAVLKVETQNSDNESTFGTLTGSAKWLTGALGHDTKIYSGFWNATTALIIRTSNDSTYNMNTWAGSNQSTCGINALPDGRLIPICANIPAIPRYYTDAGTTSREADFLLSPYWNKF